MQQLLIFLSKMHSGHRNFVSAVLPTKDEASDTIVQNLYCLFPYIYDALQF